MNKQNSSLAAPRYWPIWMVIGIIGLLTWLPFNWQKKIGKNLGKLLAKIPSRAQRAAKININLCFPELSVNQRKNLFEKSFESVGIAVFETAMAWWRSKKRLQSIPLKMEGVEHLTEALKRGKGILACSPHLTTLELAGCLFTLHHPLTVVYRPQKNPILEYLTRSALDKHFTRVIARDDIRGILKALKNNEVVWYAPDVDAGLRNSVFVPFFGTPAATITATSRYAKMADASVITAYFYRNDSGYDIFITPPLENFPSDNLAQDAERINGLFEKIIRAAPEQYLWQYKRFKTRPPGEARLYH